MNSAEREYAMLHVCKTYTTSYTRMWYPLKGHFHNSYYSLIIVIIIIVIYF